MATRKFGANPGFSLESVVDSAGIATVSNNVELTVDWSTLIVSDANAPGGGTTRAISKNETYIILDLFAQYIERMTTWPLG